MTRKEINPLLVRRPRGGISRVVQDQEILEFINSLEQYYTIKELRKIIVERFGEKRAPSRSSLGRFLTKITKENLPHEEVEP